MTRTHLILLSIAVILAGCQNDGGSQPRAVAAPTVPDVALARELDDKAYALIKQGKHTDAEPLLKRAVEADVTFGPARNNLGLVYFQQGKLYPAAWEFQNAIRLMPYQPEPRNNLGLVLERAGKPAEAIESFERARKMEPDNPEFIGNLVRVKRRRNDRDDEMKKLLQEVVFKDPRPAYRQAAELDLLRLFGKPDASTTAPTTAPTTR